MHPLIILLCVFLAFIALAFVLFAVGKWVEKRNKKTPPPSPSHEWQSQEQARIRAGIQAAVEKFHAELLPDAFTVGSERLSYKGGKIFYHERSLDPEESDLVIDVLSDQMTFNQQLFVALTIPALYDRALERQRLIRSASDQIRTFTHSNPAPEVAEPPAVKQEPEVRQGLFDHLEAT